MRRVQGSGPPPGCWCHSPADSCHKHLKSPQTSLPNSLISLNRHLTEKSDCLHTAGQLWEKSESLCDFVPSHIKLHCPPIPDHVPLSRSGPEAKCCHMVGITGLMTDRWTQELNSDSGYRRGALEAPTVQTGHSAVIMFTQTKERKRQRMTKAVFFHFSNILRLVLMTSNSFLTSKGRQENYLDKKITIYGVNGL